MEVGLQVVLDMQKKDTKISSKKGPALGWDVIVIGGGPAGIMAAIAASENGLRVALIEKNNELGKKLLLTGNGRCNITNAEFDLRKLVANYNQGGEFLFHAFSIFGTKEIIEFLKKLGVKTKIENNKRVFPTSNESEEVLEALVKKLLENKVKIIFNSNVEEIKTKGKKIVGIVLGNGENLDAKKYIICTGGKSFPATGSDGLGYLLSEKLGHKIITPLPALSSIKANDSWIKKVQAISLDKVKVSIFLNNSKKFSEEGEVMFTHFGITGPAILNISGRVGELLQKNKSNEIKIGFDLFPKLNHEEVIKELEDILKRYPNKTVKNILSFFMAERLAEVIAELSGINKDKTGNNMSKIEKAIMAKTLKNFEVISLETLGFEQAWVTKGGISLKEIDHKTMASKIISNLFFAGEIIDVDGKSGGYNLQLCWSTGYLAGKSAAQQ